MTTQITRTLVPDCMKGNLKTDWFPGVSTSFWLDISGQLPLKRGQHGWSVVGMSSRQQHFVWLVVCLTCLNIDLGCLTHNDDVTMSAMASQITSLKIVYSTVYSGTDQRKHQSSASLAFVRGIHWWPVNSGPVTRKMLPLDDVIMYTVFWLSFNSLWVHMTGVHFTNLV